MKRVILEAALTLRLVHLMNLPLQHRSDVVSPMLVHGSLVVVHRVNGVVVKQ